MKKSTRSPTTTKKMACHHPKNRRKRNQSNDSISIGFYRCHCVELSDRSVRPMKWLTTFNMWCWFVVAIIAYLFSDLIDEIDIHAFRLANDRPYSMQQFTFSTEIDLHEMANRPFASFECIHENWKCRLSFKSRQCCDEETSSITDRWPDRTFIIHKFYSVQLNT